MAYFRLQPFPLWHLGTLIRTPPSRGWSIQKATPHQFRNTGLYNVVLKQRCPTLSTFFAFGDKRFKCDDRQLFRNEVLYMITMYFPHFLTEVATRTIWLDITVLKPSVNHRRIPVLKKYCYSFSYANHGKKTLAHFFFFYYNLLLAHQNKHKSKGQCLIES